MSRGTATRRQQRTQDSPTQALRWAPVAALVLVAITSGATAATRQEIDGKVDLALERFYAEVPAGAATAKSAKGVLVFPNVVKAGFGIGGEYGVGALRVDGASVDYYSTTAASVGLQIGAEQKTIVLCFMTDEALAAFRKSNGFEVGVDGSVAVVDSGAGGAIGSTMAKGPVVGFVFGRSGLMANISLEGAKISKIRPE
jgi:lipid-binding SYLF domain-containing protein